MNGPQVEDTDDRTPEQAEADDAYASAFADSYVQASHDNYWSGTGELMGDESYERYLNS